MQGKTDNNRRERVRVFTEETAGTDFARQVSAAVYSILLRNLVAYTYTINEVTDRVTEMPRGRLNPRVLHLAKECERGYDDTVRRFACKYNLFAYKYKIQDFARHYLDALAHDLEVIRFQVYQAFTKHGEPHKLPLSYAYTSILLADYARHQWHADTDNLKRTLHANRHLLPAEIDVDRTFAPMRPDRLCYHLDCMAKLLEQKGGAQIDLNADTNIELAKKILRKNLEDISVIEDCLRKSGLTAEE